MSCVWLSETMKVAVAFGQVHLQQVPQQVLQVGAELHTDQIFQRDAGAVFVGAHTASTCASLNDMQVIQIMCELQKVFQVYVNMHDRTSHRIYSCRICTLDPGQEGSSDLLSDVVTNV
ncbi:hypothetical protein EYF80_035016 [Liparis tanakae]|uniref:Uncharacterized protein n=1 Tax=Liparis tanakae TaxID=230148 RepID=A0A4Z2GNM1_9TELE|nr:hypothetical protein EYF80_035016 [Liparis tanakae]